MKHDNYFKVTKNGFIQTKKKPGCKFVSFKKEVDLESTIRHLLLTRKFNFSKTLPIFSQKRSGGADLLCIYPQGDVRLFEFKTGADIKSNWLSQLFRTAGGLYERHHIAMNQPYLIEELRILDFFLFYSGTKRLGNFDKILRDAQQHEDTSKYKKKLKKYLKEIPKISLYLVSRSENSKTQYIKIKKISIMPS